MGASTLELTEQGFPIGGPILSKGDEQSPKIQRVPVTATVEL